MTPTPTEKAIELVDKFRSILMEEDTDCGNEILCTIIAKRMVLIEIDEILSAFDWHEFETPNDEFFFWNEVKSKLLEV